MYEYEVHFLCYYFALLAAKYIIYCVLTFRLGVAAHGYEDKGVENLRYKLSGLLSQRATYRPALPVQIATASALLGLLSFDFEEVIRGNSNLPATTSQSIFTNHIRHWFSSLRKEQQALSYSLLQSSGKAMN